LDTLHQLIAITDIRLASTTVLAFALTLVGVPIARTIASRLAILAPVDSASRHRQPVPLLGGGAIIGAILLTVRVNSALPLWMLIGVAGLFAVGLFDDAVALRPTRKLMLQAVVVISVLIVWQPPLILPWPSLNAVLVAFWLLSTINAFNLIDGLDGLAGGIGMVAASVIALLSVSHSGLATAEQALAIGGALGGFLIFNTHPASIFMGDSGALPLGFLLGALALEAGCGAVHLSWLARSTIPVLVMLAPLLDMMIASVSRAATGTPVTRRGLDHSHHRLLALGLSDRLAVSVCWAVAMIAGGCALAVAAMPREWLFFAIPFVAAFFGLIGSFMIDLTVDALDPGLPANRLPNLARFILGFAYKRRLAEVALDFTLIVVAYLGAFLLRLGLAVDDRIVRNLLPNVPLVVLIAYGAFSIFGLYRRNWSYAGATDVARLANAAVASGILLVIASYFLPMMVSGSIVVLFVTLLFGLLLSSRLSFVAFREGIARLADLSGHVNRTVTSGHVLGTPPADRADKIVSSEIPASEKALA
jgi:UDP-GlcNAc:undecaprenyl-phosphate GlcNAc-1-phosphate transferase